MHKTGSTTLQNAFKRLKSNQTKYASFVNENHSEPMFTIFKSTGEMHHLLKKQGFPQNQVAKRRNQYLKTLIADINDKKFERLIISGEDCSLLSFGEQRDLCNFFLKLNCSIKIFVIVRNPDDFALSLNVQKVKAGKKKFELVNPRYKDRLEGYLNTLGKENIIVCKYENLITGDGLLGNVSRILNVKLPSIENKNTALSREAVLLLIELNSMHRYTFGDIQKYQARRYLISQISTFFHPEKGFNKLNSKDFNLVQWDLIEPEIQWLERHFDIKYLTNKTNGYRKIHSNIEKFDSFDQLKKMFEKHELLYCKNYSIKENLSVFFDWAVDQFILMHLASRTNQLAHKIDGNIPLTSNDASTLLKISNLIRRRNKLHFS